MSDLLRRRDATQATVDQWKGKRFRLGEADCVRLAASHLRRMGHTIRLPAKGRYRTLKGAIQQLAARGHADLAAALDAMGLQRITPAAALPGDIVALPSDHPIGCLTVAVGNGRVIGWLDDVAEASILQPVAYTGAWRALLSELS